MKRPGRAVTGLALMAVAGSLAVFINARYFEGPKLCVGVMAQLWAKEKNSTPNMFMREHADLLDLKGATNEKLNEAWQNWITEVYARNHSPAEAAQWMEAFRKQWNCV
jgi:hypothetical protein